MEAADMIPSDPEELRPTPLVERTCAVLCQALVTADPLADVYHDPLTAGKRQDSERKRAVARVILWLPC